MKLLPILILLTVTLASASCQQPVVDCAGFKDLSTCVEGMGASDGPTDRAAIRPISPPEDTPQVHLDSCRARLVDVVRQARAYLGFSRPYLDVGPVEREIRMIGRDTLLAEMDTLLQECP